VRHRVPSGFDWTLPFVTLGKELSVVTGGLGWWG